MRGQAALEYLISYGWAIATVLIMIGALSYFTGFYVKILPSVCSVDLPLACVEFQAKDDGTVVLAIHNGGSIDLTQVNLTLHCNEDENEQQSYYQQFLGDAERLNTTYVRFHCPINSMAFKADIFLSYVQSGETVRHTSEGKMRVSVE